LHRILLSNVLFIALFPITGFALPEYLIAINKCKIPGFLRLIEHETWLIRHLSTNYMTEVSFVDVGYL
jgi:hypothetical protein